MEEGVLRRCALIRCWRCVLQGSLVSETRRDVCGVISSPVPRRPSRVCARGACDGVTVHAQRHRWPATTDRVGTFSDSRLVPSFFACVFVGRRRSRVIMDATPDQLRCQMAPSVLNFALLSVFCSQRHRACRAGECEKKWPFSPRRQLLCLVYSPQWQLNFRDA